MEVNLKFKKYLVLHVALPTVGGFEWVGDTDDIEDAMAVKAELKDPRIIVVEVKSDKKIDYNNSGIQRQKKVKPAKFVSLNRN